LPVSGRVLTSKPRCGIQSIYFRTGVKDVLARFVLRTTGLSDMRWLAHCLRGVYPLVQLPVVFDLLQQGEGITCAVMP
jgi:hypothetical protein